MESDKLYRVQEEDLPRLQKLLTVCFARDPLYHALIPDDETRKKLLPQLFSCDLTEFFHTCEIYSDSSELNSILVVSDETESYNILQYCFTEAKALLTTDGCLIREDPSLKTFWNFFQGKDYLNSSWTDQLHQTQRLHVIYLAVDPAHQHRGLAEILMDEVICYAQEHKLLISLETHNPDNVPLYEHFGFKTYGIVKKKPFNLKQYCMIKEASV
ncbi:MAG: N-acetyltransferase [Blautia sp.]|nr:N-acetyltransferase [Blautia sp.]